MPGKYKRKSASGIKVSGRDGDWVAYDGSRVGYGPQKVHLLMGSWQNLYKVEAAKGRTPFEAMQRFKRLKGDL